MDGISPCLPSYTPVAGWKPMMMMRRQRQQRQTEEVLGVDLLDNEHDCAQREGEVLGLLCRVCADGLDARDLAGLLLSLSLRINVL